MRAYTIALWSVLMNLALGVLTLMPLFGVALSGTVLWSGNGSGNYSYVSNSTFNYTTTNGSMVIIPVDRNLTEAMNFSGYHVGGMTELNFFDAIFRFAGLYGGPRPSPGGSCITSGSTRPSWLSSR